MNFPNIFQNDQSLSELTTFGIGGAARYFVEVKEISTMQQLLCYCYEQDLPYFILGKGSNCLFDDKGFDGLVIANRIDFCKRLSEESFYVGAGYSFSLLGSQTARYGLTGLEFAAGIPASVGGAVYMNAGANGQETCESLVSVDFVTRTGELIQMDRSEINFAYRYSSFQDKFGAIVGATFKLMNLNTAREKQLEIIHYRKKTQPYGSKSAGCVFRNPLIGSAGALIDQIGLKGKSIGGAQISEMHANFVVNTGTATAQDVLQLMDLVQKEVKEKTGIELENEIRYVPYILLNQRAKYD